MTSNNLSPVTTIIARRIQTGKESAYEAWVRRTIDTGSKYPGHLGVDVIRPTSATTGLYLLLVRFDSAENQQQWQNSDDRAALLKELDNITIGDTQFESATGLETWFTLPDTSQMPLPAPSRHKMALVISVAIFILALVINLLFGPLLNSLNFVARVAILAVSQVALLTYVVMPWVTRLLKGWLYPARKE